MEQDLTKEPTTSPKKASVNVTPKLSQTGASSSAAKVVVFTPDQLQKFDFAKQLQDVINKQVNPLYKKQIYKKRHPKLVKDKITKTKVISKEQNSESLTKSLKKKFSQVVKLDYNLLPDSVSSESSVVENIQSGKIDVRDEDVVKSKPLFVKKRRVIPEIIKLKTKQRQILNKNEADSCDTKDDNDKNSKITDDIVVEEQANMKEEVTRDLFSAKIRLTEDVTAVQQSKDAEASSEATNLNESRSSEKEDIEPELTQDVKNTISDETKCSEIVQVSKQLNEANVSFELVKPHQMQEQSVTVGETMEEIAEEVKQINADQIHATTEGPEIKQRIQEIEIDGSKEEENNIDCINQNIQNDEPVSEVVQLEPQSRQCARMNEKKSDGAKQGTVEEVLKLNLEIPISPIIQKTTSQSVIEKEVFTSPEAPLKRRQSVSIDYAEKNENNTEVKKLLEEEKETAQNVMEESEKQMFVVSEVVQAKSLLTRRNSRKSTEENCEKPNEELVKEFTKLHEKEEEVADKNQKQEEEQVSEVLQLKPFSTRRQSARKHIGRARGEAEEEKIEQTQDFNEEFGISKVGQLKSPVRRRLSVRIDYAKDNGNIKEIKKLHETEKKEETPVSEALNLIPLLTRRQSKAVTDEEKIVESRNLNELKSPSKRRLSVRIDYAKNNQNIEEVIKSNETEKQSLRKSENEEEETEGHQHFNEEFAISNVGQLKSSAKRRLSVRIDYAKGNENMEKSKKLVEEEKKESVVVEKKEEAPVLEVVQSKVLLTRRQSLRKDKSKEQEIEEAQYLNEEFPIINTGHLKSPSKRRLSLRIDYVKNNENIKEVKKLTQAENEVVQSNPILTRRKSVRKCEENSDEQKKDVDSKRQSITNENSKSLLRSRQGTRTDIKKNEDRKEEKCEEAEKGTKVSPKEIVQTKPRRQSERMNLKKSCGIRMSHTDVKEKQSNENEKNGAHHEMIRLKPQLKRRRNVGIPEIKNDDTKQENEELVNHNESETKEGVTEEAEQLNEKEENETLAESANIVNSKNTDTEEKTNKIKLRTYQNRSKKYLRNDETKEEDQKPNQKDILKSLELIPLQKAEKSLKTDDLESCKINKNVTEHPHHEEDQVVAESCPVEDNQNVVQLEETEKKKNIQIVTNEVVFFSPSDIQNMTKNSKYKPIVLAADPALVILQKSVNLQEVIIQENKSENEKLNAEKEGEFIVKEEKVQPRCYTRKNKANVDQNLFTEENKKSEPAEKSTTIDTNSTPEELRRKSLRKSKIISKIEVVETVESKVKLPVTSDAPGDNSTSKLVLKNIKVLQEPPKRKGRPRKSTLTSKTELVDFESNLSVNIKTPQDNSLSSEANLSVNIQAPQNNSLSSEDYKLVLKESEILLKRPKTKGRPRKSTPISKSTLVETVKSEANSPINAEALEDCSLSIETTKLADDTEILQKTPRKKGRPRKLTPISKAVVVETSKFESNLSLKPETVETTPQTPTSSGRSKRKRKVIDYSKLSKANESEVENDEDFVLKKPKKRKKADQDIFEIDVNISPNSQTDEVDCSFSEVNKRNKKGQSKNAQLFYSLVNEAKLSDTPRALNEETETIDKINDAVEIKQDKNKSNSNVVTCDVCKLEMEKKSWVNHKLKKHNNLAWKVGEKPLDLNDSKFVLGVLNEMYVNKKNHYYCDKCENVSRSVQGYLSHRSRCQKSTQDLIALQVTCEHCERVMLPVSMYTHLKFCRGLRTNDEDLDETKAQEDSPLPRKRKAAEKASQFITALKEEDDQPNERNFKYSRKWIENYKFDVVPWAKKIILEQCKENGAAKCCFKGCEYQNSDWSEIFSHFKECTKKLEGFSCKLCLFTFETKPDVIEHLKEHHADEFKTDVNFDDEESNDSYDEDNEEESCKKRKDNKGSANFSLFKQTFLLKFSKELCPISISKPIVFPSAFKWTFDFCRENFSELNLFSNWRNSSLQNLNSSKIGTYLPKQKYSVCTSEIKCQKYVDPLASDYDWKRFMLFETSKSDSGVFSIFCGGSISAMAWLPTPYDIQICEQILAVAVQPDLEIVYKVNQYYSDPGIIQFWNCGSFETEPKLQFCIAHDYNPIWCLEWCPSGCYDVETKENDSRRLGILAVGSGNSNVYLYSVCEPQVTSGKIIKMKPIKQLSLIINTEQCSATLKPHVSKISWTKAAGHQHIAVGYTNGVVALFNLNNLSDLLKYKADDELEAQQPYIIINAHVHSVTALTLSHINGGCRWLMTASADRTIKYWDLREPTTPITSSSKFVVTDGVWLTHWLCSILCFDDSCNTGITQTSLHQVRNFKSDTCNIMHSNSSIQCIHANDWINGLIQGNVAGEIQVFFPHQLLHGMDNNSKHFKKKKVILSYCRVVEKNISIEERLVRENEKLKLMISKPKEVVDISQISSNPNRYKPEPVTYKGAENKYGVVFCDYQLNKVEQIAPTFTDYTNSHREKYYPTRPNLYPMQCITKVQFNPNRSSYNYFAAGYQIGFVRIYPMKFITTK